MRYRGSVHRVAGGSVCGPFCVKICQDKLLRHYCNCTKYCSCITTCLVQFLASFWRLLFEDIGLARWTPGPHTPEMSTMGPYTMRYRGSVHRVAGGSVCGPFCVKICQDKLLRHYCNCTKYCSCITTCLVQFLASFWRLLFEDIGLARWTPGPTLQKWAQWAPIPCATGDLCIVLQGDLFVVPSVSKFARTSSWGTTVTAQNTIAYSCITTCLV